MSDYVTPDSGPAQPEGFGLQLSGKATRADQAKLVAALKGFLESLPAEAGLGAVNFFGSLLRGDPRDLIESPLPQEPPAAVAAAVESAPVAVPPPAGAPQDLFDPAAVAPAGPTTTVTANEPAPADIWALVGDAVETRAGERTPEETALLEAAKSLLKAL